MYYVYVNTCSTISISIKEPDKNTSYYNIIFLGQFGEQGDDVP